MMQPPQPLMGDSLEKNNHTGNSTLRPFFIFHCESCCSGSQACLPEDPEELELPRQGWDCRGALRTCCGCVGVAVPRLVVKYYDCSHWQRGGQTNKKKFKEKHQTTVSNLNYAEVIEGRPRELDRKITEICIATSVLCLYQTWGRAGKPVLMTCRVKQTHSLSLKENEYGKNAAHSVSCSAAVTLSDLPVHFCRSYKFRGGSTSPTSSADSARPGAETAST